MSETNKHEDPRFGKLVDENWENHREYCKMEPGYAKCFRKDMDDLFRIMEIHSIHTTLHAMQVFLEDGLREEREEAFFNLDEETAPDSAYSTNQSLSSNVYSSSEMISVRSL